LVIEVLTWSLQTVGACRWRSCCLRKIDLSEPVRKTRRQVRGAANTIIVGKNATYYASQRPGSHCRCDFA